MFDVTDRFSHIHDSLSGAPPIIDSQATETGSTYAGSVSGRKGKCSRDDQTGLHNRLESDPAASKSGVGWQVAYLRFVNYSKEICPNGSISKLTKFKSLILLPLSSFLYYKLFIHISFDIIFFEEVNISEQNLHIWKKLSRSKQKLLI